MNLTEVIIMSNIKENITELIGKTPIMRLNGYKKKRNINNAEILAKLEYLNPAGSVKDRVALAMIEDAETKDSSEAGQLSLNQLPEIQV